MNKLILVKFIAGFTFLISVVVMLGWFFDIGILKSILPVWPTMKFITAICFSLSAITLYFMTRVLEGEMDLSRGVLSVTTFTVLLIMSVLFFSIVLGIQTGIENLFITQPVETILTALPGQPSIGTMINFILIAVCGLLGILNSQTVFRIIIIGWIVTFIGLLAIIGYIVNIPSLYYAFQDISNGMALHTAILFVLLGFGITQLNKDQ